MKQTARTTSPRPKGLAQIMRWASSGALVGLLAGAVPTAATAQPTDPGTAGPRPAGASVHVSGRLVPDGSSAGMSRVFGGLIGTWTVLNAQPLPGYATPDTPWQLVLVGTEEFIGCVDRLGDQVCNASDPAGQLRLSYTAALTYDRAGERLIEGVCTHNISIGTEDLVRAQGAVATCLHSAEDEAAPTEYTGDIKLYDQ